jgi:hypothetical protein
MNPEVFLDRTGIRRIYTSHSSKAREFHEHNRLFPVYARIENITLESYGVAISLTYGVEQNAVNKPEQLILRDSNVIDLLRHDFNVSDERLIANQGVTGYIINPGREKLLGFSTELSLKEILDMRQTYWRIVQGR